MFYLKTLISLINSLFWSKKGYPDIENPKTTNRIYKIYRILLVILITNPVKCKENVGELVMI